MDEEEEERGSRVNAAVIVTDQPLFSTGSIVSRYILPAIGYLVGILRGLHIILCILQAATSGKEWEKLHANEAQN